MARIRDYSAARNAERQSNPDRPKDCFRPKVDLHRYAKTGFAVASLRWCRRVTNLVWRPVIFALVDCRARADLPLALRSVA
jgi:hypothetical protein